MSYKKAHVWWSSVVVATFVGCGILLYVSYIYEGNFMNSCENCGDIAAIQKEKLTQEDCQRMCYSKECVVAANFVLENMDETADPCEDFYTFTCGNWMKQFSKEEDYSAFDGMENLLQRTIKGILDDLKGPPGSAAEKLKIMYDSCMDERSSEWNAVSAVMAFLDICGIKNWPNMAQNFEFPGTSLENALAVLAAHNEFAFLNFKPTYDEPDGSSSSNSLLKLTVSPGYPLMRDESESETRGKVILQILRHFGIGSKNAQRMWMSFRNIDLSLLRLLVETSEGDEGVTILDCTTDRTDSMVHLCKILEEFIDHSNISAHYSKTHAYTEKVNYVQNVFSLIKNSTHRSLGNYLALRFVIAHVDDLSTVFRVLGFVHPDVFSPSAINKWEHCTEWIYSHMSYPLGHQYVSRILSDKHTEEMHKVVRTFIFDASYYILKQRWMSKSLRKKLKSSIENMKNNMEYYVNVLMNRTRLNLYMDEFQPTTESFLGNVMEYRRISFSYYLLNFRTVDAEEFPSDPFSASAYHYPGMLDLRFGIFLPPAFQYGLPKLLNIATMGTTVGHELGHEIVTFLEDEENFENETLIIYEEKKKCLENQYSNFTVKKIGEKVKGNQTIHENLADLIGIEITQQIITRFLQRGSENITFSLPALDYSTDQLLYILLAQMWCSVRSKETEQLHFERDVHAPPYIRIIGMLRNVKEFSDAFNCPLGNYMNPFQRCTFRRKKSK